MAMHPTASSSTGWKRALAPCVLVLTLVASSAAYPFKLAPSLDELLKLPLEQLLQTSFTTRGPT